MSGNCSRLLTGSRAISLLFYGQETPAAAVAPLLPHRAISLRAFGGVGITQWTRDKNTPEVVSGSERVRPYNYRLSSSAPHSRSGQKTSPRVLLRRPFSLFWTFMRIKLCDRPTWGLEGCENATHFLKHSSTENDLLCYSTQ